jgi:SAM-dependent methyltransferase
MFLRKSAHAREPLPMAMSGLRMGERVLQVGVDDARLAGAMAAKAGLSGHAALAVTSEPAAERARRGAADAGALLDVHVTALGTLPFDAGAFDVVVVHGAAGLLATLDAATRAAMFAECHRVLRPGGRLVAIDGAARTGLAGLVRGRAAESEYERSGGASAALERAGFRPVRVLAEREGYRFTEGLKSQRV